MDPKEYLENVLITESNDFKGIRKRFDDRTIRLLHSAMGLSTEANEFLDAMKKYLFYGAPLDEVNIIEELGDGNWYEGLAINTLETTFEHILERNIAKLKARYKGKFNEEGAVNRSLETERKALETLSKPNYCGVYLNGQHRCLLLEGHILGGEPNHKFKVNGKRYTMEKK